MDTCALGRRELDELGLAGRSRCMGLSPNGVGGWRIKSGITRANCGFRCFSHLFVDRCYCNIMKEMLHVLILCYILSGESNAEANLSQLC